MDLDGCNQNKKEKINYHTSPFGIGLTSCLCFSMLYIVSIA